jgi:hypothetical protein
LSYANYLKKLKNFKSPHEQTIAQIKETLRVVSDNLTNSTLLYYQSLAAEGKLNDLNQDSTFIDVSNPAKILMEEAKEDYDSYMNALLSYPSVQYLGKKERENANYLSEILEGISSAFTDELPNTLAISGASFATGLISTAVLAIEGVSIGAAGVPLALISVYYTLKEGDKRDKYSNLMAYLYGIESEEYKSARKGQIVFTTQIEMATLAGILGSQAGAALGNKYLIYKFNTETTTKLINYYNKIKTSKSEIISESQFRRVIERLNPDDAQIILSSIDDGTLTFGKTGGSAGADFDIRAGGKVWELKNIQTSLSKSNMFNNIKSMNNKMSQNSNVKVSELIFDTMENKVGSSIKKENIFSELINMLKTYHEYEGGPLISEGYLSNPYDISIYLNGEKLIFTKEMILGGLI